LVTIVFNTNKILSVYSIDLGYTFGYYRNVRVIHKSFSRSKEVKRLVRAAKIVVRAVEREVRVTVG